MKNKIFFIIFMFIWIVLVFFNFIIPKIEFSEQENRYLAKIPKFSFEKLVKGEFQADMEKYINDHFIFRNAWIKIKSKQEEMLGKTENGGVYIGKDGYLFEKFEFGEKEIKNLNIAATFVNKFTNNLKENSVQNVDNKEIPVYFMLVPNSIYINRDKLPSNVDAVDQNKIINDFYDSLDNRINKINVTNIMSDNKNNYLYFKTDHHMTSNGAYLVYKSFNDARGKSTAALSSYSSNIVSDSFLGTFDSKAQLLEQENDYIVIYNNENNTNIKEVVYDNETTRSIYNYEYLTKKDKYSFFLNGNNAKVVIKTNVKNNKKLLVVKDSYAHIMAQFLCNDYQEIHLIDPRYYGFSLSDYARENKIDEILFVYNVSNLVNDIGIRNLK